MQLDTSQGRINSLAPAVLHRSRQVRVNPD
jgi:hypothetical protein